MADERAGGDGQPAGRSKDEVDHAADGERPDGRQQDPVAGTGHAERFTAYTTSRALVAPADSAASSWAPARARSSGCGAR